MIRDLNERQLRKLYQQSKKILGTKTMPHNIDIEEVRKELEKIFSGRGRVNFDYAKEMLIAYEYSKNFYHYLTNNLLLDDIKSEKVIVFNNYFKRVPS